MLESRLAVSAVVVHTENEYYVRMCVESIIKATKEEIEVIVVDNGRRLDKRLFASLAMVRMLVPSENIGYAQACNFGSRDAQGEFLLFLNEDVVLGNESIDEFLRVARSNDRVGVFGALLLKARDPSAIDSLGVYLNQFGFLRHVGDGQSKDQFTVAFDILAPKGAVLFCRKRVFEKLGGFDSDYFLYFEETDLCWRIWLAGYSVTFAPKALVYHAGGSTVEKFGQRKLRKLVYYHGFRNRLNSLLKNFQGGTLVKVMPTNIFLTGTVGFLALRFGDPMILLHLSRAISWNFLNLKALLRKRIEVDKLRVLSDREVLPRIMRRSNMSDLAGQMARDFAKN